MKIFAWCDSPQAPTGFGRSALHVLTALKKAGHEVVQLAVNQDPSTLGDMPWKTYVPLDRSGDAYGLGQLAEVVQREAPDALWTTFDPEVPWRYPCPGVTMQGKQLSALDYLCSLRQIHPGFRMTGWFPVDGGPLSNIELAVLGMGNQFDAPVTMSYHVHDLINWTLRLRGQNPNEDAVRERLRVIPHGVDQALYAIPTPEQRREAKARLGLPTDAIVIGQVERNQQRKQNFLGLHVLEEIFARAKDLRGKVVLYQHMLADEETQGCSLGFNLPELAWRYGLTPGKDVFWPKSFIAEEDMPSMYQALDAFLSTSAGEGFQYPAWEALATGVPLVVPNNSARASWFKSAPNVKLYQTEDRQLVLRGAYNRRMGQPNPRAAAQELVKLIRKPQKMLKREAGRLWVERMASVEDVQHQWVELMAQQEEASLEQRRVLKIVVPEDITPQTVVFDLTELAGPADLIMAAPAIRVKHEGSFAGRLHALVRPEQLDLARTLEVADAYRTTPGRGNMIRGIGRHERWMDPSANRTNLVAETLSVDQEKLSACVVQIPEQVRDAVRSRFIDVFAADPTTCVGISCEADPQRALPKGYIPQLCAGIRALGLTPVLLGNTAQNVQRVGVVDLTGKADQNYQLGLVEQLGAVIAAENDVMHYAGMVGTPLVACLTVTAPGARLAYYAGPMEVLHPEDPIDGEHYPAGHESKVAPGEWAAQITPTLIIDRLRTLLGAEDGGPKIIRPGEVHEAAE